MDFKKDYYKILELNKTATREDIRASYRKLAKQYHPDKNPGNSEVEEKFKLINEANEILSNEITRFEYDEYRRIQEQWESEKKQEQPDTATKNKKTYQRKKTVTKEKRIYIKGEIVIKYWAEPPVNLSADFQSEIKYKIHPTDARVSINETDIYPLQNIPLGYLKSFKESDLFFTPLSQPIKCIVKTSGTENYYELELKEIHIRQIRLDGITKHDGVSFGTLHGEIFAFTPKMETEELIEEVTECFGETGKFETKKEQGDSFFRKEFYNPDCSTYWGSWCKVGETKKTATVTTPASTEASGWLQWWWILLLLLFIILYPKFILILLSLLAIGVLIYFGAGLMALFARLVPYLALLISGLFVLSAIRSFSGKKISYIKHDTKSYDSLKTIRKPKPQNIRDTGVPIHDTLINHFIRWHDYDDKVYETNLSISISDLQSSITNHNNASFIIAGNTLAPVYSNMLTLDDKKLNLIYQAFDSVRLQNNLDEINFARMIVSCIQSIPYFLVLDNSCTAHYDDEFTMNYLASCSRDCCIGYEKYGIRSPVEFVSDLKGDCDTRALFLYEILNHFHFRVALLSSSYYKHALIAVNFGENIFINGLAMNIYNRNYYLWETTSAGYNIGQIPGHLQNLSYWDIALLNQT